MKPFQNADGNINLSVREYDIASATAISKGQIVEMDTGLVTACAAAQTTKILGVAAESHSGSADALDTRANGKRILVYDGPGLVSQCPAPQIAAAAGGSATTIVADAAAVAAGFADDDFNGGYVRLVTKAADSTNTDKIGQVRRITDYATATLTFTVEAGGTPSAGDVYEVFPPVGFAKGNFDAAVLKLVLTATAALPMKVVSHDRERGLIGMMATLHSLGVEE